MTRDQYSQGRSAGRGQLLSIKPNPQLNKKSNKQVWVAGWESQKKFFEIKNMGVYYMYSGTVVSISADSSAAYRNPCGGLIFRYRFDSYWRWFIGGAVYLF